MHDGNFLSRDSSTIVASIECQILVYTSKYKEEMENINNAEKQLISFMCPYSDMASLSNWENFTDRGGTS